MTIRGISMIRKTEMMMADITEMRWLLLKFLFVFVVILFLLISATATPRISWVLRKIRATQGMKWIKMTRNLCYTNVWVRCMDVLSANILTKRSWMCIILGRDSLPMELAGQCTH